MAKFHAFTMSLKNSVFFLFDNSWTIGNNTVECVITYKLLGIIISNDLKWNEHTDYISKKATKRLYYLRILKKWVLIERGQSKFI